jgi:hypothetical protein
MKMKTFLFCILIVVGLSLASGYFYKLGYSRGSANERLHWLVSNRDGVWTARENPAHPILKSAIVLRGNRNVNSIPATYLP